MNKIEEIKGITDHTISKAAQMWARETDYDSPNNTSFAAGASWMRQHILKSEFGLVTQDEYSEIMVLNEAYANKITRQARYIQSLKDEISRLHEQQLDVDWEVEADKAGLDKETQENIIAMADKVIESSNREKERVKELERKAQQADKLAEALRESNEILRSCYSVVDREGQRTNWETLEARVKEVLEKQHKILYP